MCAVVCSYCKSGLINTYDAKIVNISHRDVWIVSHRNVMGGNLLLNRLVNPYIPKQVSSGWHLKQIEEWLLLSFMCAVVCYLSIEVLMRHAKMSKPLHT